MCSSCCCRYVRSVSLQADKQVFDAASLPLAALAESMGLVSAPRVRLLTATAGRIEGRNWEAGSDARASSTAGRRGDRARAEETAIDEEEDDDDDEDEEEEGEEDGEDESDGEEGGGGGGGESEEEDEDDEGLLAAAKVKKTKPRDKLKRLLLRNNAERRGDVPTRGAGRPEPEEDSNPLLQVRRTLAPQDDDDDDDDDEASGAAAPLPAGRQKVKIRKGGTHGNGKRMVFDDEGVPLEERYGAIDFAQVVAEKAGAHAPIDPEARVAAVRASLNAARDADRDRERERVRSKHKDQKRKRKEAQGEGGADSEPKAMLGSAGAEEGGGATEAADAAEARQARKKSRRPADTPADTGAGRAVPTSDEGAAEAKLAALLGGSNRFF